jgi:hypothetical protein
MYNPAFDHLIVRKTKTPVEDNTPLDEPASQRRKRNAGFLKVEYLEVYVYVDAPALVGKSNCSVLDACNKVACLSSCLLHALSSSDLAFDLLSSPSCCVNGSRLEFSVGFRLFDH